MNYFKNKFKKPMIYLLLTTMFISLMTTGFLGYAQQNNTEAPKNQADYIKILQTGNDEEKMDAAQALVQFNNKESVSALLTALDKEVKQKKQNNSLIRIYVISIGDLRDRAAFLPLLRLSQKSFPPDVQDEIEKAMEQLQYK